VLRTRVVREQAAVMSRPSHQASALYAEHRSVAERTTATRGRATLNVQAALMTLGSCDHLANEAQILTAVHTHTHTQPSIVQISYIVDMALPTYNTKFANIHFQHIAAIQSGDSKNVSVLKNCETY